MLKALQSIQIQELGINLKALEVPAAVYKSTHNTANTATLITATNNNNKKDDNKNIKQNPESILVAPAISAFDNANFEPDKITVLSLIFCRRSRRKR